MKAPGEDQAQEGNGCGLRSATENAALFLGCLCDRREVHGLCIDLQRCMDGRLWLLRRALLHSFPAVQRNVGVDARRGGG